MTTILSNPVTFTVAPTAVVERVNAEDMLVGAPLSGSWVLGVTNYAGESSVRATFPGQQVAEHHPIRERDRDQQVRYHGRCLATEPLTVTFTGFVLDAAEDVIQRRSTVVEVSSDDWASFSLDLDFFDASFFRLDLTFTSATATLYLEDLDFDVERFIPLEGTPTLTPYASSLINISEGDPTDYGYAFDGTATATVVTLAQAQAADPSMVDTVGGPDQIVRIDYEAYSGEGSWGLISQTRPVHEGNYVMVQGYVWIPPGSDGVGLHSVILEPDGTLRWSSFTTWDSAAVTGQWFPITTLGRAARDGKVRLLVEGWANDGPGHLYLKQVYLGSGAQHSAYSSDFGQGLSGWSASTGAVETVVKDGVPALRLSSVGTDALINLAPPIPIRNGERFLITADIWQPDPIGPLHTYLSFQIQSDPIGGSGVTAGFDDDSDAPIVPGWNPVMFDYALDAAVGSPMYNPLVRDIPLSLGMNWGAGAHEGWISNIQFTKVRPRKQPGLGFDPDWQTTRFAGAGSVTPRLPRGNPGDELIAFFLYNTASIVDSMGWEWGFGANTTVGGPLRSFDSMWKVRGEFEVAPAFSFGATSSGVIVVGNFPPGTYASLSHHDIDAVGLGTSVTVAPAADLVVGFVWGRGVGTFGVTPADGRLDLFDVYQEHLAIGTWPGTVIDQLFAVVYKAGDTTPTFNLTSSVNNALNYAVFIGIPS